MDLMLDINWMEDQIRGLELPDLGDLDEEVFTLLSWPERQGAWEVPLSDMLRVAYEGEHELDVQVHRVVRVDAGFSLLGRWHTEEPMLLVPESPEIGCVPYSELPTSAQERIREHTHTLTKQLSPLVDVFWPLCEGETHRAAGYAIAVRNLPVVVVEMGRWLGLALTGAGLDMSAHLAEAHVRCGMYPPADLTLSSLPKDAVTNRAILLARREQRERWGGAVNEAILRGVSP